MLHIELIRHVKVAGAAGLYGKTDVLPLADENALLLDALQRRANKNNSDRLNHININKPYYDAVISSPLKRCAMIAKQFSTIENIALSFDNAIQEMDFGLYDGLVFDDIPFEQVVSDCSVSNANHCFNHSKSTKANNVNWNTLEGFFKAPAEITLPKAESLVDFHHRVINAWQQIISQQLIFLKETNTEKKQLLHRGFQSIENTTANDNLDRRVAVFAHGGVIRMILAHALGVSWQQATWYQNLHIGYASLSHISITPLNELGSQQQTDNYFQQVHTIGLPLISR